MVNKNKVKGTRWENQIVELFEKEIPLSAAKRIPASGAMGTIMGEPLLQGDVVLKVYGLPSTIKIDNKVGYGGETQLTVKRDWLNKIREEAERTHSIPAVACKFSNARKADGVQYFIALDFLAFCGIMNHITKLQKELDKLAEKTYG